MQAVLKTANQIDNKTSFNESYLREKSFESNASTVSLLELLTQSEQLSSYIPNQLKEKRVKKKRKGQANNQ